MTGAVLVALLYHVVMGRLALAFHFSLDLLCDKTSSFPVVNGHVSVRNWPLPPYPHVATVNEKALIQCVLDGSTWSFICPFLGLFDTFNKETAATTSNSVQSTPAVRSYFSCCTMLLVCFLTKMCKWTTQFGGYRNVSSSSSVEG